jgi:hypothetical protein
MKFALRTEPRIFICIGIAVWASTGSFRRFAVYVLAYFLTMLVINVFIAFISAIKEIKNEI